MLRWGPGKKQIKLFRNMEGEKMKRLENLATYKIETTRATYFVTMIHLRNTNAGAPRFQANIITAALKNGPVNENYYYTVSYTFKGHYYNELDEARYIVEYHENEIKK